MLPWLVLDNAIVHLFQNQSSLLADYELDRSEIKAVMCSLSDTCDSEYFGIFSRISPLGVPLVRHRIKLRKNLLKILEIPPLTEGLNCAFLIEVLEFVLQVSCFVSSFA